MVARQRLHLSLRLFMLLCLASGLILAWLGLVHQRRGLDSLNSGVDQWVPFGDSSELFKNAAGVRGASIQSVDDLAALAARPDVCGQLEYIGIYTPHAYEAFTPGDFPNLKKVSLSNVDLGRLSLAKLQCLSRLEMLLVSEVQHDPMRALEHLTQFPRLRHLVLHVGADVRWSDFPELKQLETLRISSPALNAQELEQLRQRLPNCDVVVPDM